MREALIVWGGWSGHEPEKGARIIGSMLEADGFEVYIENTTEAFADPAIADMSLIVPIYTMSKIEKEELDNLTAAVRSGVGLAGYHGGALDAFLMRVVDVMLAFPGILLALGIVSVLGPNLRNLMIAVGISGIPLYARLVRGSVLVAKEQLYVDAARVTGVPVAVILARHILPNVVAPVIVAGTLGMGTAILAAAALSFIGLGSQPPTPEWGRMLSEGRDYLRDAWWISTFPGLAIMVTVLGVNMLGDGLRDVLDPRLRI